MALASYAWPTGFGTLMSLSTVGPRFTGFEDSAGSARGFRAPPEALRSGLEPQLRVEGLVLPQGRAGGGDRGWTIRGAQETWALFSLPSAPPG